MASIFLVNDPITDFHICCVLEKISSLEDFHCASLRFLAPRFIRNMVYSIVFTGLKSHYDVMKSRIFS